VHRIIPEQVLSFPRLHTKNLDLQIDVHAGLALSRAAAHNSLQQFCH
jgi:hypothetical protein